MESERSTLEAAVKAWLEPGSKEMAAQERHYCLQAGGEGVADDLKNFLYHLWPRGYYTRDL